MNGFEFTSQSESETLELGKRIGAAINVPCVFYLSGTLGAGKTRFVQAVAGGLGIEPETVTSPTFTVIVPHQGRLPLVHIDAYRVGDLDEAEQLGIDDWLSGGAVLMIEWAEKIAAALPPADVAVEIHHIGDTQRKFVFELLTPVGQAAFTQT